MDRAPEGRGDTDLQAHRLIPGGQEIGHPAHFPDRFLRGFADVRQAVRPRGGDRHGQRLGPRRHRVLGPTQIRHQRQDIQPLEPPGMSHHLTRVRHLRQTLGRDEGTDLDLPQPRGGQSLDPPELQLGGHGPVHALQTITRPHLTDQDIDLFCAHAGTPPPSAIRFH